MLSAIEEIWKDIAGYEGIYKISNMGRVYSFTSNRILKERRAGRGYYSVMLWDKNHTGHQFYIHRLVAFSFLGPPPTDDYTVNHKDFNKHNNTVQNLEWCSIIDNIRHAYENGVTDFRKAMRKDNTSGLIGVKIQGRGYQVDFCGEYVGWYKSRSEAAFVRYCVEQEALKEIENRHALNRP